MSKIFKIISVSFLISYLSGCIGIIGNKIKLEEESQNKITISSLKLKIAIDEVDKGQTKYNDKNIQKDLSKIDKLKNIFLTEEEIDKMHNLKISRKDFLIYPKTGCFVDIWLTSHDLFDENSISGTLYGVFSFGTLTLFPYIITTINTVKAILVDVTSEKIIKEYQLKEKSYYIVTLNPLVLLFTLNNVTHSGSENSGQYAKQITQEKLIKVMQKKVTNDAFNFQECRK